MIVLRAGNTFAGCRILSLCGSGGMGVVYLAEDVLRRKVALKIVAVGDAERELRGIQQYIRIAEDIPGMIRIYHAGIEAGQLYYIMEAADPLNPAVPVYTPKTLAALLKQQGSLPPHQVLEIIRKLGESLCRLHESHLIHRDIKPENILFIHGEPKLCDPGLVCCQDATVSFAGTLGYLPKECFNGENLNSPDRDLYALGMVFYVALTGEVPARYPRLPLSLHIAAKRKLWPLLVRICNVNAKRRFNSAAEFLAALPQEIPDPNFFDRFCESLREYRLLHPRALFYFSGVLLALLLCTAGISAFYIHKSREHAAFSAQCTRLCRDSEKRLKRNLPMLTLQLEVLQGKSAAQKFKQTLQTLPENPEIRLQQLKKLEEQLTALAHKQLPAIPSVASPANIKRLSSALRGLLDSPLGEWLQDSVRRERLKQLKALEKRFLSGKSPLKPGENFKPSPDNSLSFVYIPAGVFRDEKGKTVHIRHGFWCSDSELSTYVFCKQLGENWKTAGKFYPQTYFGWNDLLDCCRKLTKVDRLAGFLPEGFIYRPLTSQEWRWVYQNAWHGVPEKASEQKNSVTVPVHEGTPNELGIYHLNDNVGELTLPSQDEQKSNCITLCGGSFLQKPRKKMQTAHLLKYQSLSPCVGSRIAVAPGDLVFFEREHWYMDLAPLRRNDRIYHCISAYLAIYTPQKIQELCELLGGRLAMPDEPELRKAMQNVFSESNSFPIAIDAVVKDKKLLTASGTPYRHVRVPETPANPAHLLCFHRGTVLFRPTLKGCGFICEWNKAEYAQRTDLKRILKSRAVAHSFKIGNKLYVLVLCPSLIFPVRQIELLLEAKLAEPRTPELCERFKKELAPWRKKPIFLGGYRKFDRWVFRDGSELKMDLESKGYQAVSGLNASAPGMLDGKIHAFQRAEGFLLEFPLP